MIYISFDIGVKNLAYCILRQQHHIVDIIDWGIICLAESKKKVKGVNTLSDNLFCELDNLLGKLQSIGIDSINYVIIENQPSNLNGIMKTLQYMIFTYFSLLRHWDSRVGEVVLINPSMKLQNHDFEPSSKQIDGKLSRAEKYKCNKADAIEICMHYIKDDEKLDKFFKSYKKKDDLADTCLQTISYIRKKGILVQRVGIDKDNFLIS